ncbi:hypothetical protein Landi51_09997 [Colletotrichum acutatum]
MCGSRVDAKWSGASWHWSTVLDLMQLDGASWQALAVGKRKYEVHMFQLAQAADVASYVVDAGQSNLDEKNFVSRFAAGNAPTTACCAFGAAIVATQLFSRIAPRLQPRPDVEGPTSGGRKTGCKKTEGVLRGSCRSKVYIYSLGDCKRRTGPCARVEADGDSLTWLGNTIEPNLDLVCA